MNIIADQQITLATEVFSCFGHLQLVNAREMSSERIRDADVLLVRSVTPVNAALLDGSRVRFVGSATAGIDHIDEQYLASRNIEFVHAPGSNARSVAEYVVSSLLHLARQDHFELTGKSIGIIGVGEVGSRLKIFMQALGLRCLLNDPPQAKHNRGEDWLDLATIQTADIISLHVPLITTAPYPTVDLVNRDFLKGLKPDVILINTSRGAVINEVDLQEFIAEHTKARLVLDAWCHEPSINTELLQKTSIATAHIAGSSFAGKLKATRRLAGALAAFSKRQNVSVFDNLAKMEPVFVRLKGKTDLLYQAVRQVYDINEDNKQLKKALDLPATERGYYFDSLRKDYRIRREFSQAMIKTGLLSTGDEYRLRSLGFKLDQT